MSNSCAVDPRLVGKYDTRRGSWYTLYPNQSQWHEDGGRGPVEAERAIDEYLKTRADLPTAVYTHFPYCERQCFFCQCATVISRDKQMHRQFLEDMRREIEIWADRFERAGKYPNIRELHFGGGSPSLLDEDAFAYFVDSLKLIVDFSKLEECSLEIDPRFNVTPDKLYFYADQGVDRISFGVQDFDPAVMKAVNRVNPPEMIAQFLESGARPLFKSVNFDIIFGLPKQTVESHVETIRKVLSFRPERTNICKLGHRPDVFPHQGAYKEEDIPDLFQQAQMKVESSRMLVEAGYERIGFDHFALPEDRMGQSKIAGRLHRNPMGYSPGHCIDIIGIGPSAISTLGPWYLQHYYMLPQYREHVREGKLPVVRYLRCDEDDMLRRRVIYDIFLYGRVDKRAIEAAHSIGSFDTYFEPDLKRLQSLIEDGLASNDADEVRLLSWDTVNPRHLAEAFDAHLQTKSISYAHSREFGDGRRSFNRREQIGA